MQGGNESPSAFLERLLEAYRNFSPMDPMDLENQRAVVMTFTSQAAPDIRHKLQILEGFKGKVLSDLVAVAEWGFNGHGSSFIDTGRKRAGVAVVHINQLRTETKTIWAVSLPAGTSSQKTELIGLTQALILSRGKKATIYTDSRVRVCHHTRAQGNIQGDRAAHLRRESHKKQRNPQTPGCPLAVPATCNCTLPRTSKRCLT